MPPLRYKLKKELIILFTERKDEVSLKKERARTLSFWKSLTRDEKLRFFSDISVLILFLVRSKELIEGAIKGMTFLWPAIGEVFVLNVLVTSLAITVVIFMITISLIDLLDLFFEVVKRSVQK